jgi:hypothetical protein
VVLYVLLQWRDCESSFVTLYYSVGVKGLCLPFFRSLVGGSKEGYGSSIGMEELVRKHSSDIWNLVLMCLMWTVWRERNRPIF